MARLAARLDGFRDRYPLLGPLVYLATVLYVGAQVVAATSFRPTYSLSRNTISDLGNTVCGPYGGRSVCSPRHGVMNGGFLALGVVMAVGSVLIAREFTERGPTERTAARIGFGALAAGGAGAVLVCLFPENTVGALHTTGAALAIGVGTSGIVVLGAALTLPPALRLCMVVVGPLALAALGLYASGTYLGLGIGGMERVASTPETVWLIVFGAYLTAARTRARRHRPNGAVGPSGPPDGD